MSSLATYTPPGRIGDPSLEVGTDSRIHPQLRDALIKYGLAKPIPLDMPQLTAEQVTPLVAAFSSGGEQLFQGVDLELPGDAAEPAFIETSETYKSFDGVELKLFTFQRADTVGKAIPAVIYFHGGAMVMGSTYNPVHVRWTKDLAAQGVLAILADFRNAYYPDATHPFPTGLNDCAEALKYVHANKKRLGISKIILQGESGGGNLVLSTTLKAKREGFLDHIAGVYAAIPYISNAYAWSEERKLKELPSLVENDGYFLAKESMSALGWFYGPNDMENPHAWPYYEKVDNLKGLPPHTIALDELDPLRDEGHAYYQKLLQAGVSVSAKVNLGTTHGSALIFRKWLPDYRNSLIRDIATFATAL